MTHSTPTTNGLPKQRRTIIYTRVSTDEQAERGTSLRDQEARLRAYCQRTERTIIGHYQDDHSAKTFDRPAFKALLHFLDEHRGVANELLVVKWDRFGRDMMHSLNMIEHLNTFGVEVQAAEQEVNWTIPEQRMMIAIYLASPEVENRRRSQNVKGGMRRAMREGRWCNQPPKGYERVRDENGRATIAPSEKADLVREAFRLAADTDLALEDIRRRIEKRGLKISRSRFYDFLKNPVYKGRICIEAWRDEPEEEVLGRFQHIIPPSLFARVQRVRFGSEKGKLQKRHSEPRHDLVLRGHLACPACSEDEPNIVTGSLSRGRLGHRYAYYHCHHCGNYRVPASDAHDALQDFFRTLQITPEVAALHRAIVNDVAKKSDRQRRQEKANMERKLKAIEEKLFKADEALVEGNIPPDSHQRMKTRYDREAITLRERLTEIRHADDDLAQSVTVAADLFQVLPAIWKEAMRRGNTEAARDLIGSIAPEKLVFDGEVVRTPFGSTAKALFGSESQKTKNAEPANDSASCQVPHIAQLSNRFAEEMRRFYQLEPVLPVTLLEPDKGQIVHFGAHLE